MKKFFAIVALMVSMVAMSSCGNQRVKSAVEAQVDSTAVVAADSLDVQADTVAVDTMVIE